MSKDSNPRADSNARTTRGRPFQKGNTFGFKKGQSGNPKGRPKHYKLTEALTAKLAETVPGHDDTTVAQCLAEALIKDAVQGNVAAIKEIGDRTEGRPRQQLDINANITHWTEVAHREGIPESDVIREAKLLIAAYESGGDDSDGEEAAG